MSINCVRQFGSDHAESSSRSKSCLSYASQRFSVASALTTVQLSRPQVKSKSFVMFWSRVALGIEKPLTWREMTMFLLTSFISVFAMLLLFCNRLVIILYSWVIMAISIVLIIFLKLPLSLRLFIRETPTSLHFPQEEINISPLS